VKDLTTREDIEFLVDEFYKSIIEDDLIGHFFTEIVKLDWDKHMPLMYDFWETTLLGNMKYGGNPMLKHIELHGKEALKPEHFDRWSARWESAITKNFRGGKAEKAIQRARQIAHLMQLKIEQYSTTA